MTLGHRVPEAGQPAWVFSPRNSEPGSREQPVTERLWDRGPSWPPSGTTPGHPGAPGSRTPGPPGPIQAPAEEVLLWDPGLGALAFRVGVPRGGNKHEVKIRDTRTACSLNGFRFIHLQMFL